MRKQTDILKDLRKYSDEIGDSKGGEQYEIVLVKYNNILNELRAYYKIYCRNCDKEHSECKCIKVEKVKLDFKVKLDLDNNLM